MKVKDVMTKPVATCRLDANLAEAAALMWENDCGVLPVLAENGELAGIVTDRDICIALGTRNVRSSDLCVREVIGHLTRVCKPTDEIHTALQTMREGKIRRLPVVNAEGELEGIVSMDDVVLSAKRGDRSSFVSYGDIVTTLQAIYAHESELHGRPTAA